MNINSRRLDDLLTQVIVDSLSGDRDQAVVIKLGAMPYDLPEPPALSAVLAYYQDTRKYYGDLVRGDVTDLLALDSLFKQRPYGSRMHVAGTLAQMLDAKRISPELLTLQRDSTGETWAGDQKIAHELEAMPPRDINERLTELLEAHFYGLLKTDPFTVSEASLVLPLVGNARQGIIIELGYAPNSDNSKYGGDVKICNPQLIGLSKSIGPHPAALIDRLIGFAERRFGDLPNLDHMPLSSPKKGLYLRSALSGAVEAAIELGYTDETLALKLKLKNGVHLPHEYHVFGANLEGQLKSMVRYGDKKHYCFQGITNPAKPDIKYAMFVEFEGQGVYVVNVIGIERKNVAKISSGFPVSYVTNVRFKSGVQGVRDQIIELFAGSPVAPYVLEQKIPEKRSGSVAYQKLNALLEVNDKTFVIPKQGFL
ncbi:hypothetical protein COV16_05545 [Candidatus Woesearchaeota archaeon CG10_big_fil_rev_8_21_14_0_10_34_8]|nr:MAG: hypothetical protein COV16_05545 [Candidatus Woesearchaeota archaeon CG10_big_fil_rev_8_21_14_0_10_34_8]